MEDLPRLDILLYAHDGRGLGHASRSIAIGMALRRLYPAAKVLFLSGCKLSQELIGPAQLDWLKLPSYETAVENGQSRGIPGNSNYEDADLGILRAKQIRQIIETYRPRLVLADHSPQGKHKELLKAINYCQSCDTRWVLGIRGVIGQVSQVRSDSAAAIFKKHYCSLLWYGDQNVLGKSQIQQLSEQYGIIPYECGYVSRMSEISHLFTEKKTSSPTGTISVPWIGEKTPEFLNTLYNTLSKIATHTRWKIFLDATHRDSHHFYELFGKLSNCLVEKPSQSYLSSLMQSQFAIIYGGYNSLMDVLSLDLPSLVIERDMQDNEQQQHLDRLLGATGDRLNVLHESCSRKNLMSSLQKLTQPRSLVPQSINLSGAKEAANHLFSLLP